ncbi:Uncharacterised protein [Collinsella aerofaciens]|uniref:Uncharacterized protein n=1 Tax=Collinsella aerofaciens TaxID=74426 RepID=A0A5K1JE12_9ACTN|nr:hypothetical protein [Collinsella aerofaciens]VWM02103.1 Uncharacterised protein [Collinsella aerofaciens]
MKQHVRDDEFANTILLPDPPDVLNVESLKAIRDGDALIARGKPSRSNAKIARHPIGGLPRTIQLYEQNQLDLRRASISLALALANALNCAIENLIWQPVTLEYDSKPCSSETINSKTIAV